MPTKRDPDATHASKLLRLFSRLFFSDRSFTLTELSALLGCSKQTVQRLVQDIEQSLGVHIEQELIGKKRTYRMPRQKHLPTVQMLSIDEMQALHMCAAFAQALLGRELFDEATKGLEKSTVLLPTERPPSDDHFASLQNGYVDYSPHQHTLRTLIEAMEQRRVCVVEYRRPNPSSVQSYRIKPLKLFSYRDGVYLHTRLAPEPGKRWQEPDHHPLLAVHRILDVELTEQKFVVPKNYDFDRDKKASFGVWQNEPFAASIVFDGWAAEYVSERRWSVDQKIERRDDGSVVLHLTARGKPELASWVLSFGAHARLLAPAELVDDLRETLHATLTRYDDAALERLG